MTVTLGTPRHRILVISSWFRIILTLGLFAFASSMGIAAEVGTSEIQPFLGKKVSEITFSGLKRIEKDAVLAKLGSKATEPLTVEKVKGDIQALFGMGYFDDIEVQGEAVGSDQVKLIFVLRERPVISKIDFEGNERIATTDLKDVTKIKEWSILDINKVKEDIALIQKHYEDKGFYLAKVGYTLHQTKPNEVELIYKVSDFEKVQIKKIIFLNNHRYTDEQLKAVLGETKEGGAFSFLNSSGSFKESAFKQDLQRLTYYYLDHGYVKFRYENPVVTVSDDKKWLFISIYVDEGEQYAMGSRDFSGDLLFSKDELHQNLTLNPTETFSISKRNADIQTLTEKYQDLGYAFVNVIPKMNIHDENKTVDIDYGFEKGGLVHYGEINVLGNTKTHDKVIRRELKIHEGELYSGSMMRKSKENVERLGFFTPGEVIFNTVSPKGKPDILNVEITVKERSTGTITLGAGYGSVQKFFLTATIAEINLFGRGQSLSLSGQYAADRLNKSLNLGFTDPYAFDTVWSLGFDVFAINQLIPNRYTTRKLGFDLRAGYPLADYVNGYITYKNEGLQIEDVAADPALTPELINPDIGVLSSIVWSVIRDKRNNRFETTGGNYQSASIETAGIGGDKKFFKYDFNNRYYQRIVGDLVFRNSIDVGHIEAMGDRPLPPSEKFFLGGPNNLKGYQFFTVGPTIPSALSELGIPLGGVTQMYSLFEFEFPIVKEAGLKFVTFFDVGNAFERWPKDGDPFVVHADTGVGVRWFSPIGPLRFEWGFPFRPRSGDNSPQFNFFIGPPF